MIIKPIKTRVFKERENLLDFLEFYVKKPKEKSIIVITSKIVALSEGRTAIAENITTKEKLIKSESEIAIPTKHVWLTIKDGMAMAAAGIDESNANGKLILLPRDSFKSAREIRSFLLGKYKLHHFCVLITDSRTLPFRSGVTGVALGYAGFKAIRDYIGEPDIFGRKFKYSRSNYADGLASAAVCVMGEGAEQRPLAVITNSPVEFCKCIKRDELRINLEDDMYLPLFSSLKK